MDRQKMGRQKGRVVKKDAKKEKTTQKHYRHCLSAREALSTSFQAFSSDARTSREEKANEVEALYDWFDRLTEFALKNTITCILVYKWYGCNGKS